MKGNDKILDALNVRLSEELTAINQYMVHSEMCKDWGYDRLHEVIEKRAITEMKHAEILIGRIIFLEGVPVVHKLNDINIGKAVDAMLKNDLKEEHDAVKNYNESSALTIKLNDHGTKEILEDILEDEEEHVDYLEELLDQIDQMGLPNFLAEQIKA